jgi:hypothetical protein
MYFKPVDEMSLRHLFSSSLGEEVLNMSYVGPVLDAAGNYQTSPDCLLLDKRQDRYTILRCEFKYTPSGREDFEHNGQFDIAVVWSLPATLTNQELLDDLSAQNGCQEIVVLREFRAFSNLPKYHIPDPHEFNGIAELTKVILHRDRIYPTTFAAYIAARIHPKVFRIDMMVDTLSTRFREVRRMQPRGRANVVSALVQTHPPLLRRMHGRFYRWNDEINPNGAAREIEGIIRKRFGPDIVFPDAELIERFKQAPQH